jgi:tetratricopeptide (TPR) repeat protein
MSPKITRQEMKRNDLAETVNRALAYVSGHRKGAFQLGAIVVGVGVVVGGFFLFRTLQERAAGRALSRALTILEEPIAGEQPAGTTAKFASATERRAAAVDALKEAAAHGSTPSGRAAQVILAADGSEKPGESLPVFEKAARRVGSATAAAAEIDAARLLAAQGKTSEAIDRLKRAIESSASAAPKDALLFALAGIYEQTGATADARATYQRLIADYPNSPYRADARQKVPIS